MLWFQEHQNLKQGLYKKLCTSPRGRLFCSKQNQHIFYRNQGKEKEWGCKNKHIGFASNFYNFITKVWNIYLEKTYDSSMNQKGWNSIISTPKKIKKKNCINISSWNEALI